VKEFHSDHVRHLAVGKNLRIFTGFNAAKKLYCAA
jgi:hypothetical protein